MSKPDFVYTTYIATTPEKAWQALIEPEHMRHYWIDPAAHKPAHVNISDWRPGSTWKHERQDEEKTIDMVGEVVEVVPPSRLVLSWARPRDADNPAGHSRVTFDIEPCSETIIRLTVTHDGLDAQMLSGISGGWPRIVSAMKTYLESGRSLQPAGDFGPGI